MLWLHPFIHSGVISLLICSKYWAPTNLGSSSFSVLSFALSHCSWGSQGKNTEVVCHFLLHGPHSVRPLHHDPSILGDRTWHGLVSWVRQGCGPCDRLASCLWLWFLSVCSLMHSLSAYQLLGFILPWTWGISSRLLQQSAAVAPYLGSRVAPLGCCPWFGRGVVHLHPASALPLQLPCICTTIAAVASNNSTTYCCSYSFCYCDRIVCMLTGTSKTIIKTNVLK